MAPPPEPITALPGVLLAMLMSPPSLVGVTKSLSGARADGAVVTVRRDMGELLPQSWNESAGGVDSPTAVVTVSRAVELLESDSALRRAARPRRDPDPDDAVDEEDDDEEDDDEEDDDEEDMMASTAARGSELL